MASSTRRMTRKRASWSPSKRSVWKRELFCFPLLCGCRFVSVLHQVVKYQVVRPVICNTLSFSHHSLESSEVHHHTPSAASVSSQSCFCAALNNSLMAKT